MADTILGTDADRKAFIDRETLRYAVSREMFCQKTGAILDVRTAVLVTAARGEDRDARVVTGEAWDQIAEAFAAEAKRIGATTEIIDGRQLHARRKGRA